MEKIPQQKKFIIFEKLSQEKMMIDNLSEERFFRFLGRIWDLDSIESNDGRFANAHASIWQHYINNSDWNIDYIFLDYLGVTNSDKVFLKFLEIAVSPEFRDTEEEILLSVAAINKFIEEDGYQLIRTGYVGDLPTYFIKESDEQETLPSEIKINEIPFFVKGYSYNTPKRIVTSDLSLTLPCLVLVKNTWNDFTYQTYFEVYYYSKSISPQKVGSIKIMADNTNQVYEIIPQTFTNLSKNYCSLGQDVEYYQNLKKLFPNDYESVLFALKDAAFFSEIHEKFEDKEVFKKSLIRYDEIERLLRQARYIINDYDLSVLYKFDYLFQPNFLEAPIKVSFNFDSRSEITSRIYTLIGKNGTGKTQLISSIPLNLYSKNTSAFLPKLPLFSKIIAVSYSVFDKFETPKKTASFNYSYCGLKEKKNRLFNEDALQSRFYRSARKIGTAQRTTQWKTILENFINENFIKEVFKKEFPFVVTGNEYTFIEENYIKISNQLSSGQNIMLYIITEIVANIRYDSLILFDEPETHLHPNAVSQLMNAIYDLVNKFESYCIIATHSPLIVQETLSRNVYIFDRDDNTLSIRNIASESFGENLTVITEDIFGTREVSKYYKELIKSLVMTGKSYEYILDVIKSDKIPLNDNLVVYIKNLILNRNEESETFKKE